MPTEAFVGVDVGLTGGVAALIAGAPMPVLFEMPTYKFSVTRIRGGKRTPGEETELETQRLVTIFEGLKEHNPFVLIEKAQVRPARAGEKAQGVVSQSRFYGQMTEIRGVLYALRIPFELVHSATWKADVFRGQTQSTDDDTSSKEIARMKAIQMYPMLAERLALKKTHGVAEALLIATYASKRHGAPF